VLFASGSDAFLTDSADAMSSHPYPLKFLPPATRSCHPPPKTAECFAAVNHANGSPRNGVRHVQYSERSQTPFRGCLLISTTNFLDRGRIF
jgi:hypothetical protein